jgi:hypothetical protein
MGYDLAGEQGAVWAIIAAILILLPGIDRSMSASGVPIVATLLGASVGTVAGSASEGRQPALDHLSWHAFECGLCHRKEMPEGRYR